MSEHPTENINYLRDNGFMTLDLYVGCALTL